MNKIKVGDALPDFELQDQNNETVRIHDHLGQPMVIYFYPKDDTFGCTKEACAFRDQHEAFLNIGCKVFGISSDSTGDHKKFSIKYNLPFQLLSDTDNKVRQLFGVPTNLLGFIPGRVTYIIDKTGKIISIYNSQVKVNHHVTEALKALQGRI